MIRMNGDATINARPMKITAMTMNAKRYEAISIGSTNNSFSKSSTVVYLRLDECFALWIVLNIFGNFVQE